MYKSSTFSVRGISFVFVVLGQMAVSAVYAQLLTPRQQKMQVNIKSDRHVASFKLNDELKTPSFINFTANAPYSKENATDLIKKYFELSDADELRLLNSTEVPGGLIVERYKQYRSGVKVEHSAYVVTIKDSKIFSINAESFDLPSGFTVKPKLQEQLAKAKVLNFTNAKKYAWEELQQRKSNARMSAVDASKIDALIEEYKPKGELVISKSFFQGGGARLAYKYDVYATEPLSRNLIYVDAVTGEILLVDPIIKHASELQKKKEAARAAKNLQLKPLKAIGFNNSRTPSAFSPFRTSSELGTAKTRYAGVRNIYTTRISVPLLGTTDPNNTLAPLTYSGIDPRVPIITAEDVFILKDDTRGKGVETFDLNGIGGLPISVPGLEGTALAFVDRDNNWKDETTVGTFEDLMRGVTQPPSAMGGGPDEAFNDDMAIDAHWGAEMVYDYWKARHGRLSYDNANTSIRSYVHYGPAYDNAFWNGSVMTYGDGSGGTAGGFKPLVSLDVCGHEIGHGVCSFTADLVYAGESGAMNEGLSDIWSAALENFVKLNVDPSLTCQPFQIGEQIDPTAGSIGLRRMDDPKAKGNPDTYGGVNWTTVTGCTPNLTNDQCGVHNNSGVINKWFYLLVNGPKKTTGSPSFIDDGRADLVTPVITANIGNNYGALTGFVGLGFIKAEKITYLMELMLTPNATYAEAREASINAAKILYGDCSQEVETTTDAWFGVNVGAAFTSCVAPLLTVKSTVTSVSEFAAGGCDRYTDYVINTNLTAGQLSPLTVTFSAPASGEYQIIPSSVTYAASEKGIKPVVLRVFDDAMVEGDEVINITASSSIANFNLSVTVVDDDVTPVLGGTTTLLSQDFESTAADAIPTGWAKIDKITPSPVVWKVASNPLPSLPINIVNGVLYWPGKRAIIQSTNLVGQLGLANYRIQQASQTILSTPKISALGLRDIKVSFVYSAGGEPGCATCDYGQLVYSTDGVNFSPIPTISTQLSVQLTDATVNATLPESFNNQEFYLGFLWTNDASVGGVASITIDNVLVTGEGSTIEGDLNAAVSEKVFPETNKSSYFYSTNDHQLMVGIKSASADLGCVSVSLIDAGVGSVDFYKSGGKRTKKAFQVTPTQNSSASYTISLYYKTSELASGFASMPADLKMVKTDAATFEAANSGNTMIVTPDFEDQSAKGYYRYSYTFTGFSKFFLGDGLSGALPVTLVNFDAGKVENTAKLTWSTASEQNSGHFGIERSADAIHFAELGTVKSAQNASSKQSYSFSDQSPMIGINYYRLKMVDLDGIFAYSKILPLEFDSPHGITVFPNPVSNKVTVKFSNKETAGLKLMNISGQVVKTKTVSGISSEMDVTSLPEGMYLLEISHQNGVKEVQKVVIVH